MADTETDQPAAGPPPQKKSRAGRNLPAAIAVGAVMGFGMIAILLYVPYVWIGVVAVAIAVATHEVVRRLREAGYVIPIWPLLIGGQAMIWLTWPFGTTGALGAFGGTVLVCLIWRLRRPRAQERPAELPARRVGNDLPGGLDSAVRRVRRPADLSGRRLGAGVVDAAGGRVLRHRRLHGGGVVRQAPDGSRRSARRSRGRASPGRCCAAPSRQSWPSRSCSNGRRGSASHWASSW